MLIIGGRYGSLTSEGISYTETEYRYAKKIGLPVLAFVHAAPEDIPLGRSEQDEKLRLKLMSFRDSVMQAHPIREWRTGSELGGLVSRSLSREIKINPRPGWIRNDGTSPIALLEQISRLTDENKTLRDSAAQLVSAENDEELASGTDKVELRGDRRLRNEMTYEYEKLTWSVETSWDAIWRQLGPALLNEATEDDLQSLLKDFNLRYSIPNNYSLYLSRVSLANECWSEVLIQFRALGFIVPGPKKRGVNDRNSYWGITPRGDRHLVSLLARRKSSSDFESLLS